MFSVFPHIVYKIVPVYKYDSSYLSHDIHNNFRSELYSKSELQG